MKRSTTKQDKKNVDQLFKDHPLCIGFDPDTADLHPFLQRQLNSTPTESFLIRWYQATVDNIAVAGTPIKLQSAFFEQFGPTGMTALRDIIIDAKRRGLYVILDAKRGDISSTMTAYGRSAFDQYQADALTILPWMGTDSLKALIPWMKNGRRIYIVWVSSNQSGREIQLRPAPLKKTPIAEIVRQDFTKLAKKENVLGQLGWVLGATGLTETFIKQLPKQPQKFLLPGVGAQGATFDEITAKLIKKHPESLFPISRGILRPNPDDRISSWTDYSKVVQKNWQKFLLAWSESVR